MTPTDLSDNKDVIDADPEEEEGYHGVGSRVEQAKGWAEAVSEHHAYKAGLRIRVEMTLQKKGSGSDHIKIHL